MTYAARQFVNRSLNRLGKLPIRLAWLCLACAAALMQGCEVNSFFDPSRTGRFQYEPTTIPILERIDVIEQKTTNTWAETSPPTADDLLPIELAYRITPNDSITISIFELVQTGQWSSSTRRVDPGGKLRVQEVGDVDAAGLTAQELEDRISALLAERFMAHPQVDVVIEQAGGLRYSINGYVQNWGLFNLANPDLRLVEALSLAGGVPMSTERIFVIRRVLLSEDVKPSYERTDLLPAQPVRPTTRPTVDIEELINQLEKDRKDSPPVQPGMFGQDGEPPVDIDDLEPVRVGTTPPPVDVDALNRQGQATQPGAEDSFIYVPERGEWVRVQRQPGQPAGQGPKSESPPTPATQMILQRVIQIDYERLVHGDQSQNIVIRPGDNIYVDGPPRGYIYIDGEIARPGVYNLPDTGNLTLSRLVAAGGGLLGIAIPERVDLTRKIGPYREATIRMNLAAIRQRTEPDILMRPDDHVIIGTNFIAWPLAIIRNGFRATYGYGFVLDRNFGSDVFGAEPVDNGF